MTFSVNDLSLFFLYMQNRFVRIVREEDRERERERKGEREVCAVGKNVSRISTCINEIVSSALVNCTFDE